MANRKVNLRLLQISDSAVPISGYTHSWGLEGAIARGLVRDAETLERWTVHWLGSSLGPLEGVLAASACRGARASRPADLLALNRLADASILPPSIRTASREMGEQLLALGKTWAWCAHQAGALPPASFRRVILVAPLRGLRAARGTRWKRARRRVDGLPSPGGPGDDWRGCSCHTRRSHPRSADCGLRP